MGKEGERERERARKGPVGRGGTFWDVDDIWLCQRLQTTRSFTFKHMTCFFNFTTNFVGTNRLASEGELTECVVRGRGRAVEAAERPRITTCHARTAKEENAPANSLSNL
ncbi:hypothetical protein RUM43_011148 [Polyplax serrata]|uniref:Uncharacterized protein n=1 Tax=Polyplax serrata TaxID=468196 RepID=A0AAN8S0V1_POLSC